MPSVSGWALRCWRAVLRSERNGLRVSIPSVSGGLCDRQTKTTPTSGNANFYALGIGAILIVSMSSVAAWLHEDVNQYMTAVYNL
jgi:hypothetical protein